MSGVVQVSGELIATRRVGDVVSPKDKEQLQGAGAAAIFPPGTVIADAAADLLKTLSHRLGHKMEAAE